MRKQKSLFNRVCYAVNLTYEQRTLKTYKVKDLIEFCQGYENVTGYKRWNKNPYYRTRSYQTMLKKAGFLKNVSRGEWKVIRQVPSWFDLGHLSLLLGYQRWDSRSNTNVNTYKGMTKEDIQKALETNSNPLPLQQRDNILKDSRPTEDLKIPILTSSKPDVNNTKTYPRTNWLDVNNTSMEFAKVEKIDKKESQFFNEEPSLSTGEIRMDIAVNIGVLESAKAVLSQFVNNDTFVRARVYNVMAQLEHISKELQEKANLI